MSYFEIFFIGWNLNVFMFLVNLTIAFKVMSEKTAEELMEEDEVLSELKTEFEKYYPNKRLESVITYLIPFAGFFKSVIRIIEILFFFSRNKGANLVDYMIYKYKYQIKTAKDRLKQ